MDLDKFQQMVETTIDLAATEQHEFIIKADFDERLRGKRLLRGERVAEGQLSRPRTRATLIVGHANRVRTRRARRS